MGEKTKAAKLYAESDMTKSDLYFTLGNMDYTKENITSFDVRTDRRKNTGIRVTLGGSVNLFRKPAWSDTKMELLGSGVNYDFSLTPELWFHYVLHTAYDTETGTITYKLYKNGTKLAGNSKNVDASYLSNPAMRFGFMGGDGTNTTKAGGNVYYDNIKARPLSDANIGDISITTAKGLIKAEFGLEADETTLDPSAVVIKNAAGETIAQTSSKLSGDRMNIYVDADSMESGALYTLTLPEGVKDILGGALPEESRTVTFKYVDPEIPEVTVTSPVSGMPIEKGQPIILAADASVEEGSVDSVEYFADGVSIGTATAAPYEITYTPESSGVTEITAKATANGKSKISAPVTVNVCVSTVKSSWNFSDNPKPNATSGTKWTNLGTASSWTYYADKAAWAITTPAADTTYGNALGFSVGGGRYKLTPKSAATGIFTYAVDVLFTSTDIGMNMNTIPGSGTANYDLIKFSGGKIQNPAGTYKPNVWYNIRLIYDMNNKKYYVFMDNRLLRSGTATCESVGELRFDTNMISGGTGTVYFDNSRVSALTPPLVSQGVAFKDADGAALSETSLDAYEINSIEWTFDREINAETITDAVKLYRGYDDTNPVGAEVSASGNTITIVPQSSLVYSALYRLTADASVASTDGSALGKKYEYTFRTSILDKGMANGKFYKDGVEITDISSLRSGDSITFKVDVQCDTSEEVWIIAGMFSPDELKSAGLEKINPEAGTKRNAEVTFTLTEDGKAGDILSGFVWNKSLFPYGDNVEFK